MFRAGIVLFLVAFLACGALVGIFSIEKFKIKNIEVNGNSYITKEQITGSVESIMSAKILGVVPQDRIFSFPEKKAESVLESRFGRLSFVEVKKQIPDTISVSVKEREPAAILCVVDSKDCSFVDDTGFIFEKAPFFSSGVFVKFFDERREKPGIGQFLISRNMLQRLFVFLDKAEGYFDINDVYLDDEGVYKLQTNSGPFLLLSEADDWSVVFSNLETFLEGYKDGDLPNFEYIDLRFGNKVFYKEK